MTKRARGRVARAMVTVMRVVGNEVDGVSVGVGVGVSVGCGCGCGCDVDGDSNGGLVLCGGF